MHLQQTKSGSRESGGPQYYFHGLTEAVRDLLRTNEARPVVLQTPYGIAETPSVAVDKDHKLDAKGRIVRGNVGHDRIQARGEQSIGEAIRQWYGIRQGTDFERIDVDVILHPEGHFILVPLSARMRGKSRSVQLGKFVSPLSFTADIRSPLWTQQISGRKEVSADDVEWAGSQMRRVVGDHRRGDVPNVHEADLLRTSGALAVLGLQLGPYVVRGLDCPESVFHFDGFPAYPCPVEVKKRSSGFTYQMRKHGRHLPRAVVLCIEHDLRSVPDHVDVLELAAMADYLEAR